MRGLLFTCLLLTGCDIPFLISAPANTLSGSVEWNDRPAPGKAVELLVLENGQWIGYRTAQGPYLVSTNNDGRFTFSDLPEGSYRVQYVSQAVKDANGNRIGPSEVAWWRTNAAQVGSRGAEVPAFDVAFNGLIYPETGRTFQVSESLPMPFHWATHPRANQYQVRVLAPGTGGQVSTSVFWESGWVGTPTAVLAKRVSPGNYGWEVWIDGGASGEGLSTTRLLDLSSPSPSPTD